LDAAQEPLAVDRRLPAPRRPGRPARRRPPAGPPGGGAPLGGPAPAGISVLPLAEPNPEYSPLASQCQMSTAASLTGLQLVASTTVIPSFSGAPLRPSVMSLRTLSSSM